MSDCRELAPLLAALPLGVLEPEDEARAREHLAVCPTCPMTARQLAGALDAAALEKKRAPDATWEKLKERIARDQVKPEVAEPRVLLACSFCHSGLVRSEAVFCASCLAPHHQDCFQEHGRCSAPGCGETQVVQPKGAALPRPERRLGRRHFALLLLGGVSCAAVAATLEYQSRVEWGARRSDADAPRTAPRNGPERPELGMLQDGVYKSRSSAFEIRPPEGWVVIPSPDLGRGGPCITLRPSAEAASVGATVHVHPFEDARDAEDLVSRAHALTGVLFGGSPERESWLPERSALDSRRTNLRSVCLVDTPRKRILQLICAAPDEKDSLEQTFERTCRSFKLLLETKPAPPPAEDRAPPVRVLYVEAGPRWEWRYLKQVLEKDPRVLFHGWLLSADSGFEQPCSTERGHDPTLVQAYPRFFRPLAVRPGANDLSDYDLVILGDLAEADLPDSLVTWVEKGGTLVAIAGDQHQLAPLAERMGPAFPVVPLKKTAESVLRRLRPTPGGMFDPLLRLGKNDPEDAKIWQGLPGPYWLSSVERVRDAGRVLVETAEREPVLVVADQGRGKIVVLLTDETWRWRSTPHAHESFWKNVVQSARTSPAAPPLPEPPAPPAVSGRFQLAAPVSEGFAASGRTFIAVSRDGAVCVVGTTCFTWRQKPGVFGDPFSKPTVLGERAYVGTAGGILVLDLGEERGALRYEIPEGSVVGTPLVLPKVGRIICGTSAGEVYAFDAADARVAWHADLGAPLRQPGAALDGDGSAVAFVAADGKLAVFESASGARDARIDGMEIGELAAPPVLRDGTLLCLTPGHLVRVHRGETAGVAWQTLPPGVVGFAASLDGELVLLADERGDLIAHDAANLPHERWRAARGLPGKSQLASLPSNPAHPEEFVLLDSDGVARIFGLDGALHAVRKLAWGTLSVGAESLVVADEQGAVHVFPRP